jgi:hypothetical protein
VQPGQVVDDFAGGAASVHAAEDGAEEVAFERVALQLGTEGDPVVTEEVRDEIGTEGRDAEHFVLAGLETK